jgi:hypothetical protein
VLQGQAYSASGARTARPRALTGRPPQVLQGSAVRQLAALQVKFAASSTLPVPL